MGRILTGRRLAVVTAAGMAAGLVSTAAGAVKTGTVAPMRAPVGGWEDTAAVRGGASPAAGAAGDLTSPATCVTANASRTVMTHAYDAAHRTWVVHLAKRLCSSLFVQDAQYRRPARGRPEDPRRLATTGRLVRMQAAGTYRVPLVLRSGCALTDTGATWGTAPRWPATVSQRGVTRPQQLSHWSRGPATGSSPPPAGCGPLLPPPAPVVAVAVTVACPCTAGVTGSVQVTNDSRFPVQVAVLVDGVQQAVVSVPAGRSGSVTLAASRHATLTFGYRYGVAGHFPPAFTPIALTVITSA